jgi:formate-dependent nitrite reductase cytochrome c552 subunit
VVAFSIALDPPGIRSLAAQTPPLDLNWRRESSNLNGVFPDGWRAQFRVDFVNAENSMGFHAPQEAARILAEAIDYARQGQLAVMSGR